MGFASYVLVPVVAASGVVALSAATLYAKPKLAYECLMRYGLYKAGLQQKFCKIYDYTFSYAERGTRRVNCPSLLLLHGFTSGKEEWARVVSHLPKDWHIIALDLPGHGLSSSFPTDILSPKGQVHKIYQFLDLIGLRDAPLHVAGLSMGGCIAGVFAATYQRQVQLVSLMCPMMLTPETSSMAEHIMSAKHCPLIPETTEEVKIMLDFAYFKAPKPSEKIIRGVLDYKMPYLDFFNTLFEEMSRVENQTSLLKNVKKITMPAQVIWGDHDKIIHLSGAAELEENLPHVARVDIIRNCGHAIHLEKPRQLASLLVEMRNQNMQTNIASKI